jgi:Pyridoxamine 5'-phosphate oxidase
VLPEWPAGTVLVLVTAGDPHAIPVSAAVRVDARRALIALARGRQSLARLRADPRVALAILSKGVAVTASGRATVLSEDLVPGVAGVEIAVERVQNHDRPEFEIESGVRWRWVDDAAEARDAQVVAALGRLAGG